MDDQDQQSTLVDDLELCVLGSMAKQPREDPLLDRFVRRDAIDGGVSADRLFRTLTRGTPVEGLQVVARPGDLLDQPLRGGDLLLRVALGEPRLGHVAVLVDGLLETPEALAAAGFQLEALGRGLYAHVIEAGARPHPRLARFARRVLDASGYVPPGQLLLRSTRSSADAAADESISSADESISSTEDQAPRLPSPSWQPMPLPQNCRTLLKERTRVAVVGGGLAGLMAARRLGQHGVDVKVFDGRWHWGGRVLSNHTFSNGRITEEGAELIGSFHTKWLALAREYGLTVVSRMSEVLYQRAGLNVKLRLDKDLTLLEIQKLREEEEKVLKRIAELARRIRNPVEPWRREQLPWLEEKELKAYDNMSVAHALQQLYNVQPNGQPNGRLWKAIQLLLVNDEVGPLENMNFLGLLCKVKGGQGVTPDGKSNLTGYWDELEIFRCADGCQKLADKMATEIKATYGATVALNRAVTHIKLSKHDVKLGSKRVVKRDGTLAPGKPDFDKPYDYVILAVPPSVWGGVTITAIAADGKEADLDLNVEIGQIGMGDCAKFFLDVKERFWIKKNSAPYGGSLTLGQVWEGTDNQTRVEPAVAKQGIVLSVFAGPIRTDPGGHPRVPNHKEFTDGLMELYPDYKDHLNKDNPNNILLRNWPTEPFIMTGYAAPRIGQIFKVGDKLSKPFRGRLFFAGEHTQLDSFGYMEGALRSGERAAEQLMLQACGLLNEPAPASPRPQVRIASAPPIETEILSDERSSSILDQDLLAAGAETAWEPRAAALVAEEEEALDDPYSLEVETEENGASAKEDSPTGTGTPKLSPFPKRFTSTNKSLAHPQAGLVPLTKRDHKLDDAFKEAQSSVSAPTDIPLVIVALNDDATRPFVSQGPIFDMYFTGSLLKVAALYAAYQLRDAVNDLGATMNAATEKDPFKKIKETFNPQIENAVQRITIDKDKRVPQYQDIFSKREAAGHWAFDFKDGPDDYQLPDPADPTKKEKAATSFYQNMKKMIVGSHNLAASFCIRRLGYSWINGVLDAAGLSNSDAPAGIWLAGDYTNDWPVVKVRSVNDEDVMQASATIDMARLFVLLYDQKLVKPSGSGNREMLDILGQAVTDSHARSLLRRTSPPPLFSVLQSKIGVGHLKGGSCRDSNRNRCTYSEAAILKHSSGRHFVAVWQGLNYLAATRDSWKEGLGKIANVIQKTMDKYA